MLDVLDALYLTAHDFPGGVPALAQRLDMSANVLNKKVDPKYDTHKPLLVESVRIQAMSGDFRTLHAECAELNHVAIKLPDIPNLSDMGLLDAYMQATEEIGKVSASFRQAYADGNINDGEYREIKAAMFQAIGKLLAFLAEIERVKG
ncbi:MAG TPA: phage regulatory CII family protein [Methylophilaceae bacterium]|nr:phage regulatory CII family protein [Methylophilaceae bacterium]